MSRKNPAHSAYYLALAVCISSVLPIVASSQNSATPATPCTLCSNGASISKPNANITVPGYGVLQCQIVATNVGLLLPDQTAPECQLLREVGGPICGCPVPSNACQLCPNGADPPSSRLSAPLSFLDGLLGNITGLSVNCEVVHAYLISTISASNNTCSLVQNMLQDYCCQADFQQPSLPCEFCSQWKPGELGSNQSVSVGGFTTKCSDLQQYAPTLWSAGSQVCTFAQILATTDCQCPVPPASGGGTTGSGGGTTTASSCSLCKDGSHVTMPDRLVPFLKDKFGGIEPTCAQVEAGTRTLTGDACHEAQLIGSFCGCPALSNFCTFCPVGNVTRPNHYSTFTRIRFGLNVTCEELQAILLQYDAYSMECFLAHETNWECGCNNGFYGYLGTENVRQQTILAWLPRCTGIISIMGSLSIIIDFFLGDRTNVYRQLMALMSCFDICTSVSWIVGPWSIPKYDIDGNPSNIYGAMGNNQLCTAQGKKLPVLTGPSL